MLSVMEKDAAGWPLGWVVPVQSDLYSYWRGWFARRAKIVIVGRVALSRSGSKCVADERVWAPSCGSRADSLEDYAVIAEGFMPGGSVHPVGFDADGGMHVLGGGAFGRRWAWDSGYRNGRLGLPSHPLPVMDVFDGGSTELPIVVE